MTGLRIPDAIYKASSGRVAACLVVLSLAVALAPIGSFAQAPVPSYKELKFPSLREVEIPNIEEYKLANGMRVYLLENHELPLVSGFALVRTGNLFDPPQKIGLAEFTGSVMRTGGTTEKTGDELDIQLENIAASVESSIGESSAQVSFSALKENTDEVMHVFRDVLTSPEFRQPKIDLLKLQTRSAISRRNDNQNAIGSREFNDIVYGKDTPYGWRIEYEHLDRIMREDLISFYRRYYFPANIMLAVYGDFSTAEMKARLEKLFGSWNYTQPPVPPFPDVRRKASPGVFLAEKQDVNRTAFAFGHLGGILKDKNEPALEIMADILGGGFSSRLFRKIRTQLGYAYGVGSNWGAGYLQPGLFQVSGSTKSESTVDAIRVAREEVERIRTTEVSDQELETAKQTVLNGFVFNFDTPSKTLSRLIRYEYFGYPRDFIFQYQKAIERVTKADVLRAAKDYIRPNDFTFVAVGNPKDFGQPLSALGLPVNTIDLTIPQPKSQGGAKPAGAKPAGAKPEPTKPSAGQPAPNAKPGERAEPGATKEPASPAATADPASIEKGRELLKRVQQSFGGAERLASVRDFTSVSTIQLLQPEVTLKQTNRWVAPSYFRQDIASPAGAMATYFDGVTGWVQSPQGTGPMPPSFAKQAQAGMFRMVFPLLLSDRDPNRTVAYAGNGGIRISDSTGNSVTLQMDENTGNLLKESYTAAELGGSRSEVEEIYAEWIETDGIRFPKRITVNRAGKKFADITNEEIKVNSGLNVEELRQRQ